MRKLRKNYLVLFAVALIVLASLVRVSYASSLSVSVITDASIYHANDLVTMNASVTSGGTPVDNASVFITVVDKDTMPVYSGGGQTDSDGNFSASFRLSSGAKVGNYTVYVSAVKGGYEGGENQTTFEVVIIPTYSNVDYSSDIANTPCTFSCLWQDDTGLLGYYFSCNNTGTWVNDTWVTLSFLYTTGYDSTYPIYGTAGIAQTFTTSGNTFNITSVWLYMCRSGSPGTLTVGIRATDGNGHPTGSDLTTGSINANTFTALPTLTWYQITLTEYTLLASTKYAIVCHATSGTYMQCVLWGVDESTSQYNGGCFEQEASSGSIWTSYTNRDCLFRVVPYALEGWANTTKTLINTSGAIVEFKWYCEDNDGYWNQTLTYNLTVITYQAPEYSSIAYSTRLVNAICVFSSYWTDDYALSGFIFSWKQGAGAWTNETWTSLSGASAWANKSETLPNYVGVAIYYRWFCNNSQGLWTATPSSIYFATLGYYFYFDYKDLDSNSVDNIITWTLWIGATPVSYTEGAQTLIATTYTLKSSFRSHELAQTSLATSTYGNTHVTINLYVKSLGSSRYVAFDKAIIWISLGLVSDSVTMFTVTSSSSNILMVVDVPRECLYIQKNGVNETGWTYSTSPSKHMYKTVSSLSSWEFYHAIYVPPIIPTEGEVLYFLSDIQTTNTVTGYLLDTVSGSNLTTLTQTNAGDCVVSFGFRISIIKHDGSLVDLTSITAILIREADGEGFQNGYALVRFAELALGYNGLKVRFYVSFDNGTWLASGDFVTDVLLKKAVETATWNFTVYTKRTYSGGVTTAQFLFGDQTHNSRIDNICFVEPLPQELALFKLGSEDIIGALLLPYLLFAGNLFYGIGIFFVGGVLYLRHKKWETILVFLLLFAGSSGVGFLIPNAALRLVYIVAWFVLAIVLYRVFKS